MIFDLKFYDTVNILAYLFQSYTYNREETKKRHPINKNAGKKSMNSNIVEYCVSFSLEIFCYEKLPLSLAYITIPNMYSTKYAT